MEKISIQYYKSPVGELIVGIYNDRLCICDWRYRRMRTAIDARIQKGLNAGFVEEQTAVALQTIQQLDEYFDGSRSEFDIPLLFVGTEFQKSIWNELMNVGYGTTQTYMGLSRKIDNEKAIRAVASANGANAISIIVPCHRIVGSDGSLVGYAGGLSAKKKLLDLERDKNAAVQMNLFE
ncbi:MAG: methylated-DNA--[protein]-cysteine S-methyltransferase [Bacteroidales bacterium]|nr:methylated-DNA--[protein]-cysteine S-methyltransferase [Bacteroidales bacterium]